MPTSQFARDSRMTLLLDINRRTNGRRQRGFLEFRGVDSAMPENITFDVTQQLRRWLRSPNKNKGLSLSLKSSNGLDQEVTSFVDTGGCRCVTGDQSNSRADNFNTVSTNYTTESGESVLVDSDGGNSHSDSGDMENVEDYGTRLTVEYHVL